MASQLVLVRGHSKHLCEKDVLAKVRPRITVGRQLFLAGLALYVVVTVPPAKTSELKVPAS